MCTNSLISFLIKPYANVCNKKLVQFQTVLTLPCKRTK